jgi:SAM-dependent methyltransferase
VTSLRDAWDRQADEWARFARTPGHDRAHDRLNFPAFLDLLPPPRGRAIDIGCGEGRVGAKLLELGYEIVGVDSSPRMVALARERHEAVVADAGALPFADSSFALAIAYMSLMNVDDLDAVVSEAGRVLEREGRLCAAILHPLFAAGAWTDPDSVDSSFAIDDYFNGPTKKTDSERDGIRVTFYDRPIALSRYAAAIEGAGLLIEALREPVPDDAYVRDRPLSARLRRVPIYLHFRAIKP